MSKYKLGDKILVQHLSSLWELAIYIKDGKNNGVICVDDDFEAEFNEGNDFNTTLWPYHKPKPEKKYRPYTIDEANNIIGKVIKYKATGHHRLIIGIFCADVGIIYLQTKEQNFSVDYALENVEFIDGTPCGVEVTEDANK